MINASYLRAWTEFILSGLKSVDCRGRLWCKLKYFVWRAFTTTLPVYGKQNAIAEFSSFLIPRLQVICLKEEGPEFVFVLQNVQIKMNFFMIHQKCKTYKM